MIDFFKRIIVALDILKQSFFIFIRDAKLITLSFLHAIALYVTINAIVFGFYALYGTLTLQERGSALLSFTPILAIIITWLLLYFVFRSIQLFFSVAIARSYLQTMQKKTETVMQSLKRAFSTITTILEWVTTGAYSSLYTTTKPVKQNKIEANAEPKEPIVALEDMLEFSWETTNLLAAPIMAQEDVDPVVLAKHENSYLKQAFGEKIIVNYNFRLINYICIMILIFAEILAVRYTQKFPSLPLFAIFYATCLFDDLQAIYQALVYAYVKKIPTKLEELIKRALVSSKWG